MAKKKKSTKEQSSELTGLDVLIERWFASDYGCYYPRKLEPSQIAMLARNWDEVRLRFTMMAVKESPLGVDTVLKQLRDSGVSLDSYLHEELYPALLHAKKYMGIGYVAKDIGIMPTPKQLDELWKGILDSQAWYEAEYLPSYIGHPDVPQELVDKLGNDWLATMANEKERKGDLVQPEKIEAVLNSLGKTPQWDKKLARRAYNWWLGHHFHEPLFKFLQEKIGVRPPEKKVQEYYTRLLTKESHASLRNARYIAEELKRAVKFTGILPNAEAVQHYYDEFFNLHELDYLRRVEELTNIRIEETTVQKHYEDLLTKGWTEEIAKVQKVTGISPVFNDSTVRQVYASVLQDGDVHYAMHIHELTAIAPKAEPKVIEACFKALADDDKNGRFYPTYRDECAELKWLCEHFPQAEKHLQQWLRSLLAAKKYSQARRLPVLSLFDPLPEDEYVLACISGSWDEARKLYREHGKSIEKMYPHFADIAGLAP